jgi:hypothetical protein
VQIKFLYISSKFKCQSSFNWHLYLTEGCTTQSRLWRLIYTDFSILFYSQYLYSQNNVKWYSTITYCWDYVRLSLLSVICRFYIWSLHKINIYYQATRAIWNIIVDFYCDVLRNPQWTYYHWYVFLEMWLLIAISPLRLHLLLWEINFCKTNQRLYIFIIIIRTVLTVQYFLCGL